MQRDLAAAVSGSFLSAHRGRPRRSRVLASLTSLALLLQVILPTAAFSVGEPPVAAAGSDRAVTSGLLIVLDGTASSDPGGGTLGYGWTQTGGPSVTLAAGNREGSKAEFVAPLVAASTDLTFRLTVTNGTSSATDDVKVTVLPGAMPMRISSQPGRSGWQDIESVGRNVYLAWCYRNGGGLNIWFTKSTDGGATYERPQQLTFSGTGDSEGPRIAVEGDNVYIAWREFVSLPGPSVGGRIRVAISRSGGVRGSWSTRILGEGASAISLPEIAASADGPDHDCFVLYQARQASGNPLILATSRDGGSTFSEDTVEDNASDQSDMRALAAFGGTAYVSYVGSAAGGQTPIKLYSRSASSGAEARGSFAETYAHGTTIAVSDTGRVGVAWHAFPPGASLARASIVDTATMTGTKTDLTVDASGGTGQSAPEIAWAGGTCFASWVQMASGTAGGTDYVCTGRVRTGGGLTDAQKVTDLTPRPSGSGYYGGLVSIAGAGELVGIGWWDQMASRAYTAVSRDAGHTFEAITDCGTWLGESGGIVLASNDVAASPAVHASMQGNLRMDADTNDVSLDLYVKRLAAIGDDDLVLEKLQVVQAPWDDSPTQRLAKDKTTAFRLDVANGYATAVTTRIELRYTQVTAGTPNETVMTQEVTLPPFDTKHVYFDGILLTGDSVSASATVNTAGVPSEADRGNNEAGLASREIVETQKLDCLYVPLVLPGDTAPTDAQFYSAVSSWGRYIAEAYPIDDRHWLSESRPTITWTPKLDGYVPGTDLTSAQHDELDMQLDKLASLTGHETALAFVRPGWFKARAYTDYKDAVGLAPYGGKRHVGVEEVGLPAQIGAHELAHTYGLIPAGTPGNMPSPNDSHFDRLIATGYSASRGEITVGDPKSPTFDFMQWTAVPNTWVSPTTYYLLMDQLKLGAPDPEVVLLSGDVDRAAMTGALDPAYRFDGDPQVVLGGTGDLRFVFKDGSDGVLDTAGFDPTFSRAAAGLAGTSEDDYATFSVKVPWVPGTEKIELVYKGTLLDTVSVSPHAPTVAISSPAAGAVANVGETVAVEWTATDADGGTLRYQPVFSLDEGATWAPLCAETVDTSCTFVPSRQMVTEKAQVKVIVTDGVNSAEAASGVFAIRPVVPASAGGGGVPTWGPIRTFPEGAPIAESVDPYTWSIGADGSTLYAGWLQPNSLWDPLQHLRIKRSFDNGATWEPASEVCGGGIQADSGVQDFSEAKFFEFRGDTIYTLHSERIDASNSRVVLHKSTNGGTSFDTSTTVTSWTTSEYPRLYRPHWLVEGDDVYVFMERYTSTTHGIVLFKSTDGGATFGSGVSVAEGPWNGVGSIGGDPVACVADGQVYVSFTYGNTNTYGPPDIALAKSVDGGATFSAPQVVLTDCYAPAVAAEDGHVYVVGGPYPDMSGVKIAVSDDYGTVFGAANTLSGAWRGDFDAVPKIVTSDEKVAVIWQGRVAGSPTRYPIWSAASTDGGATFAPTWDLLGNLPTGVTGYSGHTWPTMDETLRVQGDSIYLAAHVLQHWTDPSGGGQKDAERLAVFTSSDFGATFGQPDVLVPELGPEDANSKAVLAVTPGFVYAGTDLDRYFTDYEGFVVCGSTGKAPAITAGEDLSVSEAQLTSLTADFSADSAAGATATFDWGDGTQSAGVCGGSGTTGTVDGAHAYGTYGTYHAMVTLSAGGQTAEDAFMVTVADVAPELSVPATATAATVGLPWRPGDIAFSDVGWDDPISATVDWGDGSDVADAAVSVTTPGGGAGEAQAGSIDATHTYVAAGTYEAVVTVSDGAVETTASFPVVVRQNHDPVAVAGGPYVAEEGSLISLDASASSDPDPDALTYAWTLGDTALGSPFADNERLGFGQRDDFSGTVRLEVRDGRGGVGTAEAPVWFVNVAPSVTATESHTFASRRPLATGTITLATFTDPGVLDTHTARVDWGDGSSGDGTVTESSGAGSVTGAHLYDAPGSYTVTITVTDDDGGSAASSFVLSVEATNTPPATNDVSASTMAGVPVAIHLMATDPDPDPLIWLPASLPTGGTLLGLAPDLTYVPNPGFTGTDAFAFTVNDGQGGSATADVTVTVTPGGVTFTTSEGADRYGTALAASREAFPEGAECAVLVTGENWPDGVAGASLAGAEGGPILLTRRDKLPSEVLTEIRRLGASEVIILGSEAAVGDAVYRTLLSELGAGKVRRIGGRDRYETAEKIASATVAALGEGYDGTCFIATGDDFPDALAASPLAAAKGWPTLFASSAGLRASTTAEVRTIGATKMVILGASKAVPGSVETALAGRTVVRLAGANRYDTAARVASHGVATAGLTWDKVAIATGENFPDALVGGVLQGKVRSVMLLTSSANLHPSTRATLTSNKTSIHTVRYLGGDKALSPSVRGLVAAALR